MKLVLTYPFCRIASHTSEEVRDILGSLEQVYGELFPQLNLRRWSGSIYTWLTHPILDPTHSGRVTMDYLVKLVTTALEWSYQAGAPDVQPKMLEQAAELLVLRRDTLRIVDGAGPCVESSKDTPPSASTAQEDRSGMGSEQEVVQDLHQQNGTGMGETVETVGEQAPTSKPPKCMFPGIVSIDLERFLASPTHLIECPGCGRTRTLSPKNGVLRFPPHDRRKKETPPTSQRWARIDVDWEIVGEERT